MILYHGVTNYHILEFILFRNLRHKNQKVVLLLPDFITIKLPFYEELEKFNFFDEICLLPYSVIGNYSFQETGLVGKLFNEITNYSLDNFDEIYIAGTHYGFTKYVLENNKKFYTLEDGKGALSNHRDVLKTIIDFNNIMGTWCRDNEIISGKNINIIKNICDVSSQEMNIEIDNYEDFNVGVALEEIEHEFVEKICEFFRAPKSVNIDRNTALLLTQQFSNMQILNEEEQVYMYQLMTDFFLSGYNILLKKHPDDLVDYRDCFEKFLEIERIIPFELIDYLTKGCKIETVLY